MASVEDTGVGDRFLCVDKACRIQINDTNEVSIDPAIAGDGLTGDSSNCELDVDCSWIEANCGAANIVAVCGIDVATDATNVDQTVSVVTGCGINCDATNGIEIDPVVVGVGLTWDATRV